MSETELDTRLFLQNGQVMRARDGGAQPLSARELYEALRSPRPGTVDAVEGLVPSRRPVVPAYAAEVAAGTVRFSPVWGGTPLSTEELANATGLGYFIRAGRVLFLEDDVCSELRTATGQPPLPVALPLLRKLRAEGRLLSDAGEITAHLVRAAGGQARPGPLFIRDLYPYQRNGVDWLCFCVHHGTGTILADDMGLGKTAQLIATICDILAREPSARILVVVPNPLIDNWRREFAFFAPGVVPYLHYGPGRTGLAADLAGHRVVITPYTTLTSDISMISEIPFRLAVFDEASMVKNVRSGRTSAAFAVTATVKIAVTGTPVENSLTDVWTLAELILPGYLGTLEAFGRRYIGKDIGDTLERNLGELEESVRRITLRRMKRDVLDQLPERRDIHFPVTMLPPERAAYDGIVGELRRDAGGGGANMLALISRLQQFTSHPALLAGEAGTSVQELCTASGKFELLVSLLDKIRATGEKVLVFATFQKMIDIIGGAVASRYGITAGVIDGRTPNAARQPLIDAFSAVPGFAVLLLHPRTAGMGFNITAATHVIHYSRQWNPALEMQATARAWRNGQTRAVSAYYLYYADTIEETVDERLRQKQQLGDTVITVADDKESDKRLVLDYLEETSNE